MKTTAPTPTAPEADSVAAYRLAMLVWFAAWVASMAGMCYSLAHPGSPGRLITWAVLGVFLMSDIVPAMVRGFRRKRRNRSDVSLIADPLPGGDERQWSLNMRARERAGIMASYGLAVAFVFFGTAASAAGIRIDSADRWIDLSVTASLMIVVTYTAVMKLAARYYSRRG